MRSRTAIWFECKVKYEKVQENGLQKKVTEVYVVDALSFAEAENRITEEMSAYISGEFEIADVKKASYKEISSLTMPLLTAGIRPSSTLLLSTKRPRRRSAAVSPIWYRPRTLSPPSKA